MKHMKKILALAVAAIMVVAMALPVLAAESTPTTTGSITMADSGDGTVAAAGKTFNAYKLLDVTYSGDNYAYTIPDTPAALLSTLATAFGVSAKEDDESDIAYNHRVVAAIETAATANVESTAKTLLQAAKDAGVTPIEITGATTKTGLDLGYYVIEDVTSSGDNQKPVSAVALTTTDPDVTIKVKATKPTLDKAIDEGEIEGALDDDDVEYDNHSIGDTIPYVLETTIPEMTGYTKYFFIVNDTLSKGLTFNDDVVIKATKAAYTDDEGVEHEAVTRTLTAGTDYTVTATPVTAGDPAVATGETALEIVFKDFYTKEKDHAGETLTITYSATLNDKAVIGVEGNPNTAKLTYSNNPNGSQEGTPENPDKPKPGSATGETPEEKTYTYVTGIEIIKQDGQTKERLVGAEFEITGVKLNTVLVETETFEKGTGDGYEYYKLKDGSYTKEAPSSAAEGEEGYNADKYDSTTDLYKKTIVTTKTEKAENVHYTGTTGEDGVLYFDGLAAGDYVLTELTAPTGYNPLTDPLNVTITWTAPAENADPKECTWASEGNSIQDGRVVVTIDNNHGSELPETGGVGTTLFYVIGGILVLGAAVLLITRRRMRA